VSKNVTVVDLAMHAASVCRSCLNEGRPSDESCQDQGDVWVHRRTPSSAVNCQAHQIWTLIRRLETPNA
jgi:hypothetical protein